MNQKHYLIGLIFLISSNFIFSQTTLNVLWNKVENIAIPYASIKGTNNYDYAISNENGVFELKKMDGKITIQSVGYETLLTDYKLLKANDTIFMQPLIYELDEIVIKNDALYTKMLKTVLTDYALEPHKEEFFLRTIIRKNKELYKIIDFSGKVEKKSLFDTKSKPMPKKKYKVQIDNIRKVGLQGKDHDVKMFSFQEFFTYSIRLSFNKEEFNITYESNSDKNSKKITLKPKNKDKTAYSGYYILNKNNTFREVNVTFLNKNLNYESKAHIKYRTNKMNWKSNFQKNKRTGKLQLAKGKITAELELMTNDFFNIICHKLKLQLN